MNLGVSERCPNCKWLMIAMTDRKGGTEDRSVKCDQGRTDGYPRDEVANSSGGADRRI
jgi:hypothetical protein